MRTPSPHFRLIPVCAVILLLGLSAPAAAGQERSIDSAAVAARLKKGLRYFHEGRYVEALPLLDAYVRSVYAAGDREAYTRAAHAYLLMLGALPHVPPGRIRRIVQQHALQTALLLPDGLRRDLLGRVPEAAAWPAPTWPPHPEAGAELVAWWRSQDPLPATPENERLHEHLERMARARTLYAHEEHPTGLDARGEVYVRFGPPHREHSVSITDPHLVRTMAAAHASVREVPNNVLWSYEDIDYYAFYLFVEEEGPYRLGTVSDLLPPSLQGPAPSLRGTEHARLLITLLRNLYGQLALFHPSYADRYVDIDAYAGRLSDADLMKESEFVVAQMHARQKEESDEQNQSSGSTSSGPVGYIPGPPSLGALPDLHPDEFAHTTLLKIRSEAFTNARRRAQVVPPQHSQVLHGTLPLAVAARAARFLNPDGSTRVEICWGPLPGALTRARQRREDTPSAAPSSADALLLDVAAVQRAADYTQRSFTKQRFRIEDLPDAQDAVVPPQTITFEGDTTTFHLGLQWNLYAPPDDDRDPLGPPLGTGLYRLDSLEVLQADEDRLEMSDLVPILAPGGGADPEAGLSYPFGFISPDTELTLLFELYHLAYGEEDRTHYTVEYEINRAREQGGFLRSLFGRRDEQQTAARTSYAGSSRTTREYIQLDLSQWEGEGTLQIVVRVTDETTGRSAERTISFDVGP